MFLDQSTMKPLIAACEAVLIESHRQLLVDEFQQLLIQDKNDDLARTFELLNRIQNGLTPLKESFETHVKQVGLQSIERLAQSSEQVSLVTFPYLHIIIRLSSKDPKSYVDTLLLVHKKYLGVVLGSFRNDAGFMGSLDKACRDFVNRNAVCGTSSTKSPELLARYSDALLKKSAKSAEETDLEDKLNSLVILY